MLKLRYQAGACLDGLQARLERAHETVLLQQWRTQLEKEEPHLGERFAQRVLNLRQVPGDRFEITIGHRTTRRFGIQGGAVERLRYRVVQLSREALTLFEDRRLPRALVELRVLQGDG